MRYLAPPQTNPKCNAISGPLKVIRRFSLAVRWPILDRGSTPMRKYVLRTQSIRRVIL